MIAGLVKAAKSAPNNAKRVMSLEVVYDHLQRLVREEPFETEKLISALARSIEILEALKKKSAARQATQLPLHPPRVNNPMDRVADTNIIGVGVGVGVGVDLVPLFSSRARRVRRHCVYLYVI